MAQRTSAETGDKQEECHSFGTSEKGSFEGSGSRNVISARSGDHLAYPCHSFPWIGLPDGNAVIGQSALCIGHDGCGVQEQSVSLRCRLVAGW